MITLIKKAVMSFISLLKWEKKIPIIEIRNTNRLLADKVALITGGSGGIGMTIAKQFIASGCKVVIVGTNINKINKTIQELGDGIPFIINMNEIQSFNTKINEISNIVGNIDIVVCSAGVHSDNIDFWNMTEDEYDRVMDINLKGTYFFCQASANYMRKNKIEGKILLISSSRGSEPAWSPYGLSKWGINGMIKGLAKCLAPYKINVNAIAPGSTATMLLGYEKGNSVYSADNTECRLIMPDEVANIASLLVSEAGKMINGEIIHISSGRGIYDIR